MKKLITMVVLLGAFNASACTINASKKSEKAKTIYVNGVSVSAKIITALSEQCTFNTVTMSKDEVKAFNIKVLTARLAKLTAKGSK